MMPNPILHIFKTPDDLCIGFIEFLIKEITNILSHDKNVHICLSGGSTPKIIFAQLAKTYNKTIPWDKINFYWGDERCVPANNPQSNYGEAKRILFNNIDIPDSNIHQIRGENVPEKETKRYTEELLKNVPYKNNLPSFDINILGIGEDGHTASIFPNSIDLIESDSICAISIHPKSKQKRITITGKTLNNSKLVCFLVSGKKKAEILKHIIQLSQKANLYPSYFINPDTGRLEYFLDNQAASLL